MAPPSPIFRSGVVGALACQRDSYLQTLETVVISCVEVSPQMNGHAIPEAKTKLSTDSITSISPNWWLIEFADSVLFPEGTSSNSVIISLFLANERLGGGQPTDYGTIFPLNSASSGPIPITFSQRQGLRCVHYSPQSLPPGTLVRQEVDFRRRWDHMQQHTGQHLLSAIMDTYGDLETLGWGMGAEDTMNYVELPRKPSPEEIQDIQEKCNEAIRSNLGITAETPDDAKNDILPDNYDKEKGVIRVVKIGNLDANACCGTHLSQTSHLSLLLLRYTQSVRSTNCRLYFTVGDRAIHLATASLHSLRSIAKIMSSGSAPAEVLDNVKRLNETATELKKKEKGLLMDIAKYEGVRVREVLRIGKNAWVYRAGGGLDFINKVVFEIKEAVQARGVVVLASGEEKMSGQIVIFGEKNSVEDFSKKINGAVTGIKGGGKGERWQGKVLEWKKCDLETLKGLVESSTC